MFRGQLPGRGSSTLTVKDLDLHKFKVLRALGSLCAVITARAVTAFVIANHAQHHANQLSVIMMVDTAATVHIRESSYEPFNHQTASTEIVMCSWRVEHFAAVLMVLAPEIVRGNCRTAEASALA